MTNGALAVKSLAFWLARLLLCGCVALTAQPSHDASTRGHWGDQGDNTFVNPVLPGDFSDLDAIRVGKDFFAISSTMQYSPGMGVLQSSDLVNWRIVGHVVDDLGAMDSEFGWRKMNGAGRGIWAGSIRFHAGLFRVYFGTPDGGIYVSTAREGKGPWSSPKLVIAERGWDDPCPFWDDDGTGYLVATRFAPDRDGQKYRIHLFAMDGDGSGVRPGSDRVLYQSKGSEANKMYKVAGMYLHYFSEVRPEGRVAMMERSRSLAGPWEVRQLNHVHPAIDKEPNQGGLIQLEDGRWWFLTHQGTGDWEGRAGVLLPVTWLDGWPIPGKPGADGMGEMVWGETKPIRSSSLNGIFASDDFGGSSLQPVWEWRYQPRADYWLLTGHALRLNAFGALPGRGFDGVRNVLTQRSARAVRAQVTVKVDLNGFRDGQEAGLAHFAKTDARIAVVQKEGLRSLVRFDGEGRLLGANVSGKTVWLRSAWDVAGLAKFSYSLDGERYVELGSPYQLTWGSYRGDRVGLYTVGEAGGYADFSEFRYEVQR